MVPSWGSRRCPSRVRFRGTWYRCGFVELHVSLQDGQGDNCESKRHVCYVVPSLDRARAELMQDHGWYGSIVQGQVASLAFTFLAELACRKE
jgi:hypothetical protein